VRTLAALLCVALCTSTVPARAQELVLDPWVLEVGVEMPPDELLDPPGARFLHRKPGESVPFEGVLLDLETAARWAAVRVWYQKQLWDNANRLRDVMRVQHKVSTEILALTDASRKREIAGLRADLRKQAKAFERAKKVPFYRTWTFGLVCGIVLSGVITGTSTWVAVR
jgi:hypothetical protein